MDHLSPTLDNVPENRYSRLFRSVDHRKLETDSLLDVLAAELEATAKDALLWTSKRPHKGWYKEIPHWTPLLLSSASLFEQIFWIRSETWKPAPIATKEEHQKLLGDYPSLFKGQETVVDCKDWIQYRELLEKHIRLEESETYPRLLEILPIERALRELKYEHIGLKRGLEHLPTVIADAREGKLTNREREMQDLNFYHLLEHHLEREIEAIYPMLVFLSRG